ncbi:hypothetical protein FI667_g692, partial [Globisporangium splendens]
MATSYAAWAKYDVEEELARVDAQAQDDERRWQQQQQTRAKQRVESDVSASAQQSAEVLAARAAVAALKAKARAKKAGNRVQEASQAANSSAGNDVAVRSSALVSDQDGETHQEPMATAMRLAEHAALFKKKHTLITQIMENRRLGEAILRDKTGVKDAKCSEEERGSMKKDALKHFETALKSAMDLEKIVPELLEAEKEQKEQRTTTESQPIDDAQLNELKGKSSGCGDDHCHHDHGHTHEGHSCGHTSAKKADVLPKANDVGAIVGMFFKDIYIGIGTCHLNESRLAVASEAFKEVLLRDDRDVHAWVGRGKAFEQMDANLLAMLHFSRAKSLDSQDERASEALERVKDALLSGADDVMSGSTIRQQVEERTQSKPLKAVLDSIRLVFREANVLMLEGFFQYAIPKYQIVLGCIDFVCQNPVLVEADGKAYAKAIRASLNQLRTSCHLNIAGGYQEMQKGQTKALEYCQQALGDDASDVESSVSITDSAYHFRMGQLYRSVYDYERSVQHLTKSKTLLSSQAQFSSTSPNLPSVIKKIDNEIDRCEFDRSQYDVAYIRSRLVAEFKPSTVA